MTSPVIEAVGLGKQYRIGARRQRAASLREAIGTAVTAPVRHARALLGGGGPSRPETVWALREASFTVGDGEVLGLVGRNGAGKSTVLKILSRITEPTVGHARVRGRVGSLLEVGTGFHPELTGRDNVFLNGAILGMDRAHIRRQFDEIVEFAGIGEYIDTPVKRYSSGMYLRLAFAVAAHLEPEILIVDEVLAVGDAEFQRRCMAKMGGVAHTGRTVLFVSHNMNAVQRLCTRCVLLDGGRIVADGPTGEIVARYLRDGLAGADDATPGSWFALDRIQRAGSGPARFSAVRFAGDRADLGGHAYPGGPVEFTIAVETPASVRIGSFAVTIYDPYGVKLVNADTWAIGQTLALARGRTELALRIDALHLRPGPYRVGLWMADGTGRVVHDHLETAIRLEVVDAVQRPGPGHETIGLVSCDFDVRVVSEAVA